MSNKKDCEHGKNEHTYCEKCVSVLWRPPSSVENKTQIVDQKDWDFKDDIAKSIFAHFGAATMLCAKEGKVTDSAIDLRDKLIIELIHHVRSTSLRIREEFREFLETELERAQEFTLKQKDMDGKKYDDSYYYGYFQGKTQALSDIQALLDKEIQ